MLIECMLTNFTTRVIGMNLGQGILRLARSDRERAGWHTGNCGADRNPTFISPICDDGGLGVWFPVFVSPCSVFGFGGLVVFGFQHS